MMVGPTIRLLSELDVSPGEDRGTDSSKLVLTEKSESQVALVKDKPNFLIVLDTLLDHVPLPIDCFGSPNPNRSLPSHAFQSRRYTIERERSRPRSFPSRATSFHPFRRDGIACPSCASVSETPLDRSRSDLDLDPGMSSTWWRSRDTRSERDRDRDVQGERGRGRETERETDRERGGVGERER